MSITATPSSNENNYEIVMWGRMYRHGYNMSCMSVVDTYTMYSEVMAVYSVYSSQLSEQCIQQ